jgi:hypothetical protein
LAVARVVEAELGRVKQDARCLEQFALVAAAVHTLADQGVTRLRQMNADLVSAARFESAFDQRNAGASSQAAHVRRRFTTELGAIGRTAHAIATILHEPTGDGARTHRAVRDGPIAARRAVEAKLRLEALQGGLGSSENEDARGLLVQPMDHVQAGRATFAAQERADPAVE